MSKPKIVKDYSKLTDEIIDLIKLEYPFGFEKKLILFKNMEGKLVSALPFETEDKYYLIRMTITQAQQIVEEEEDYNDEGNLSEEAKMRLIEAFKEKEDEEE